MTEQERARPRPGVLYALYAPTATDEQVRAAFRARYGRDPAEIHRTGGGVAAGPKPQEKPDNEATGAGPG